MGSAMSIFSSKKTPEKVLNPVVNTPLGKTKGFALPRAKCDEAKQVFAFMGLPFAKPPVGELRFEPPQKVNPWEGVLDATKSPPAPLQSLYFSNSLLEYNSIPLVCNEDVNYMSEDCLYINIYSNNPNPTAKMPVLVWIFGGAFNMGGAVGYNGQVICGLNDVVLVVMQYRLNVFGFFTTGKDTKWPGNMGMLDQVMALEWVRDNIAAFGGDPNRVTIFGESAGSISVNMHAISPLSRGLFHRVIGHSAVTAIGPTLKPDQTGTCNEVLKGLDVTCTEPEEIIKELKAMDASKIVESLGIEAEKKMVFPSVDGKFIPSNIQQLLEEHSSQPVPYIFGMNNSEGAGLLTITGFPEGFRTGLDKETALVIARGMLTPVAPADKLDNVVEAVVDMYSSELDDDDKCKWSKLLANLLADRTFYISTIEWASAHSGAGNDTYVYYMTQQIRLHHDDAYSGNAKHKADFCEADHGDDITFTFGFPFANGKYSLNVKYSDEERELSKKWMKTICQFAKTGNPNIEGEVEWPKYEATSRKHLVLKWPYGIGSNLHENRMKFWTETLPDLLK